MMIYRGDPSGWEAPSNGSSVAIGVFDGVHRGHRRVLEAVTGSDPERARVAMTFGVHPAALLSATGPPSRLSTLQRRFELLDSLGIDHVAVLQFDEVLRHTAPEVFVERYLVGGLAARFVAVGRGFRFGHDAVGTTGMLGELGNRLGFEVRVVDIECDAGIEIRSASIRAAIRDGDVHRAAELLGRPHELEGVVVPGDGRGAEIGVPTANVSLPTMLTIPRRGVYAVIVTIDGVDHPGVATVGARSTLGRTDEALDVHVLDLDRNLYGKHLRVAFIARIRAEMGYESIDRYLSQTRADFDVARSILDERRS